MNRRELGPGASPAEFQHRPPAESSKVRELIASLSQRLLGYADLGVVNTPHQALNFYNILLHTPGPHHLRACLPEPQLPGL